MSDKKLDALADRLKDAQGVGACLAGDCHPIMKLCAEAATAIASLREERDRKHQWLIEKEQIINIVSDARDMNARLLNSERADNASLRERVRVLEGERRGVRETGG